ncbi:SDR family NAD(P)-dependent oxidoreductase [Pseudoclavibacter sp. 13-3]|uniref:SDR family NAD(P)-dependent oxidoreductase n=1 Tax=Pseudoclavibacter sp. 13-3 TaxID=2901228 RepID=UPI001E41D065|nr:SDR family NAD(P)-dependent oxidoreductase [Pseudoclavibacter sp. 13-3]MCD7101200.1 SDR family NAD(P)-dependent oxidoreductase [Pseudoclavibacter sp. 13-3]
MTSSAETTGSPETADSSAHNSRSQIGGRAPRRTGAPGAGDRPVAIVTGATGGMGQLIVADLARDHRVIAVGRDQGILRRLADELGAEPFTADLAAAFDARAAAEMRDVADGATAREATGASDRSEDAASAEATGSGSESMRGERDAIAELATVVDRVDVVVHAAAIARRNSVADAPAAEWQRHFSLNVGAPAALTAALLPKLRTSHGVAVFINSGAGSNPQPGNAVYAMSKHALFGVVDSLRKEEANTGVRVATVSPGPTDTPMLHLMNHDAEAAQTPLAAAKPAYEIIDPVEIARAVRFVVDAGPTTQITNVDVRPRIELADRRSDAFDA